MLCLLHLHGSELATRTVRSFSPTSLAQAQETWSAIIKETGRGESQTRECTELRTHAAGREILSFNKKMVSCGSFLGWPHGRPDLISDNLK